MYTGASDAFLALPVPRLSLREEKRRAGKGQALGEGILGGWQDRSKVLLMKQSAKERGTGACQQQTES